MAEAGDRDLARKAAAGDAAAFAMLVEGHARRLHRWLVATGTAHHDAEDVVQEAFLRAHRAMARYDARWAFSTWLFTIAHRVRLDLVARRREHAPLAAVAAAAAEPAEALPEGGLWARARELLAPEEFRLLWLHYAEDQAPGAVARILGINPIAARVRLHRARKRLETALRADPAFTPAEALSLTISHRSCAPRPVPSRPPPIPVWRRGCWRVCRQSFPPVARRCAFPSSWRWRPVSPPRWPSPGRRSPANRCRRPSRRWRCRRRRPRP